MWGGKQTEGKLDDQLLIVGCRQFCGIFEGACGLGGLGIFARDLGGSEIFARDFRQMHLIIGRMGCGMEAEFRMKNSKLVEFKGMEPVLRNCKNG